MMFPLPLEQTDPALAEQIRLVALGQHAVKKIVIRKGFFILVLRDGSKIRKRVTNFGGKNNHNPVEG